MKNLFIGVICILISFGIKARNPIETWESLGNSQNSDNLKTVVIFADGYQVATTYNAASGKFIRSDIYYN